MKFLKKKKENPIPELQYATKSQRSAIKQTLLNEQYGFCAYSERFCKQTDSVDIEHFDPRKKNTDGDDYHNWYTVLSWINQHKPKKIEAFLPILFPSSPDLEKRIGFQQGLFIPLKTDDKEAQNLIDFLGLNKSELYEDRKKHINRIKDLRSFKPDLSDFIQYLEKHPEYLSFITALETELKLDLFAILSKQN